MASKYVTAAGDAIDAGTITESSTTVQTKAMTVTFNDGLSPSQQIAALEQVKDYIVQYGAENGAAAD